MSRLASRFRFFTHSASGLSRTSLPLALGIASTWVAVGLVGGCGASGDDAGGRKGPVSILTDSAGNMFEVPTDSPVTQPSDIIVAPMASTASPGTNQPTERPPNCGDGRWDSDEACDDKNLSPGDGCSDICGVENGWSCADNVCVRVPICSDGQLDPGETCDDGNLAPGDGCTELCATEEGWACPNQGMPCVNLVVCGDIQLAGPETCDDGNTKDGDGCSAACQTEPGWVCVLGAACTALCGDGKVGPGETCDDGNVAAGDGCSAVCQREPGTGDGLSWECPDDLGTGGPCTQAVCGDGVTAGDEGCDDGNNNNLGDGCSPGCKLEPNCSAGACKSTCGDGLILATDSEECDDGNSRNGDGCSSTCTKEAGFTCEKIEAAESNTLTLPIVYRDFRGKGVNETVRDAYDSGGHEDFENLDYTLANDSYVPAAGIVNATLGADGKPVFAATSAASKSVTSTKANFDQWFNDVPNVNMTLLTEVDLTRANATQPFVFDEDEFYPLDDLGFVEAGTEKARTKTWGDDPDADGIEYGCWDKLDWGSVWDTQAPRCSDLQWYEAYYATGGPNEFDHRGDDCVDTHNYSFTSEIRYWFEYKGGEQLVFRGDDDVFVFINKKLVVDLGGLHEPLGGDVCGHTWPLAQNENVDPGCDGTTDLVKEDGTCLTNAADGEVEETEGIEYETPACGGLGAADSVVKDLEVGKVYEVAVFQAERHTCQSNYQLTLAGFSQSSSTCAPQCGDAVTTAGEACDEGDPATGGMNGAGYNHCTATCTFGPRCGDGMIQADAGEACDNGKNISQYQDAADACAPGCKPAPTCGDGQFNPQHEECDLGAAGNTGAYGACNVDCTFAARCGDGNLDADAGETCDDGNRMNGDKCDAACKIEKPVIQN